MAATSPAAARAMSSAAASQAIALARRSSPSRRRLIRRTGAPGRASSGAGSPGCRPSRSGADPKAPSNPSSFAMLSSRSWRSWSVATGNGTPSRSEVPATSRIRGTGHRHDRPSLVHRRADLGGDLAIGPLARPAQLVGAPHVTGVLEAEPDGPGEVVGGERLEPAPAVARDRDDPRRQADEVGHDVEEAVALTPQERRLEDRPVEVRRRDDRLGLRLRARVVELRVVGHAERAQVDEPPDPGDGHRLDDGPGPLGVHPDEIAAVAPVARQGDEVDDGVDSRAVRPAGRPGRSRRRGGSRRSPGGPGPGGRGRARRRPA